ncbi:MAG TPA: DUF2092 domain-containing protein [Acidisphaera sp.]|nr:DUF2092 domain-containing protein [Acidisphaera sp.]HME26053.1 DUF2092 domain-containing protein [Acetobacteraceae bacterium]
MRGWISGFSVIAALVTAPAAVHAQQAQPAPAPEQTPAASQPEQLPPIEPKAVDILKAACKTLETAKAMSFTAVSTYEKAARNGQPLFYATLNQVTMQRPDKLRVITTGDGVPDEFYYNGKILMAYVPSEDLVAIADAPPTIDQMVDAAWDKAAIYFPFADLLMSKPCAVFEQEGLNSAFYVGQSKIIGGTTTDMVAVAADNVQGELWIGATDHLPRLIRVVYPHEPAHALYQTEYSDWHLVDSVDPATFASERAAKGKPMNFAPPGLREVPALPSASPQQHQ